jgi:hypothetical protein
MWPKLPTRSPGPSPTSPVHKMPALPGPAACQMEVVAHPQVTEAALTGVAIVASSLDVKHLLRSPPARRLPVVVDPPQTAVVVEREAVDVAQARANTSMV